MSYATVFNFFSSRVEKIAANTTLKALKNIGIHFYAVDENDICHFGADFMLEAGKQYKLKTSNPFTNQSNKNSSTSTKTVG